MTPKTIYRISDDSLRDLSAAAGFTVDKHDVAVIGMAVRLPGANDLEAFWEILEKGVDMHSKVKNFILPTHDANK